MSSLRIRFPAAAVTQLVLAKVGNPQREEPLQMSREVLRVGSDDRDLLTSLFLKPFRNLLPHRFHHPTSLETHEMNSLAKEIFRNPSALLENGCAMARRLYAKSQHPNIKSGDLCIALVEGVDVESDTVKAICILKSETVSPFLSIASEDGDLRLRTEHGINPEKIDKGCLILNHWQNTGLCVLTFDRSGGESRFWVREFLGLQAIPDSAFLTQTYAEMAVAAVRQQPEIAAAPEESARASREVLDWFDGREDFDLAAFETEVLKSPEAVALDASFSIEPKEVKKAARRATAVLQTDTGVEIRIRPEAAASAGSSVERGFDEERGMNFLKVWFHEIVDAS
jgi:hypothetical protein